MSTNTTYVQPPFVDSTGIHVPSFPVVNQELIDGFQSIYGLSDTDSLTNPNNPDVQYLGMVSLALTDTYNLGVSVYNSFSPQTAQGTGLSQVVKINGITRKTATNSLVDLLISGTPGTVITNGKAKDGLGQTWNLPATVVIPASGPITVSAVADQPGAISCPIGSITVIATPTRGWLEVNNPAAPSVGVDAETDAELRQRQAFSTSLPSVGLIDGLLGALYNITNVTYARVYENDTNTTDADGLTPHSIGVVIQGGDVNAIAKAIFLKKTMGCGTNGDEPPIEVTDSKGVTHPIYFYRPTDRSIVIEITLKDIQNYVNTVEPVIKQNLVDYISSLDIGESVYFSRLYKPIYGAEIDPQQETFNVVSIGIKFSDDPSPIQEQNLVVAFNELATLALSDITITVT